MNQIPLPMYPVRVYVVNSEKELRGLARIHTALNEWPYDALTPETIYVDAPSDGGFPLIAVVISTELYIRGDDIEFMGAAVHEAHHVLRIIEDIIGETNPGMEYPAYLIQYLASRIWDSV